MSRAVYLDHNAGAPARPEVAAAVAEALLHGGNPSSIHASGRAARQRIEQARAQVAALVEADPAGVIFTSGGTEANALVLAGCGRIIRMASAVEHPSVLDAGIDRIIPVDGNGIVDLAALDAMLAAESGLALVSLMLANNETGIIQPVAEAAALCHARGALFHCDAAQAVGRMKLSIRYFNADFLTLSAHKMGGPSGVGAVVMADPEFRMAPILLGGGQERRRRAGTENLSGIVGFGTAAALAGDDLSGGDTISEICGLRDRLEREAARMVPEARVIGQAVARLPNTTCLALPGLAGQTQVMALDLAGVAVSAGAACSSGKVTESRVLAAMGLEPEIRGSAIRISMGRDTRSEDVDCFLAAWAELARRKGYTVNGAAAAA
ncbi:cysteine desulfurase [Paramagnetospirillum kuznetsovii]|uniref:Cysteine desulfurase n=1 Tax=Paramagnetospirillum kuznetsovii TaxID=2053833 RepID=A0A364NWN9_9PROT|nr:cysteine desulfurase family protein [Paramagnetospirillum kuznetsovii]RAU21463.1 cysteine desulfurase [Paramagnetospirillum kuznetsovii]